MMTISRIAELNPGDVVYLPIAADGTRQGPLTVEWVREERDGTLCVGWHAGGEDHVLCLPLNLAALGADRIPPSRRSPSIAPRGVPSRGRLRGHKGDLAAISRTRGALRSAS